MQKFLGKVVGGVLGFAFGGPGGALVGVVLGHLHDVRPATATSRPRQTVGHEEWRYPGFMDGLQKSTFSIGVIVLGAKMAKADGRVSRAEIAAFRRVFNIPDSKVAEVGELFDQARQTVSGYEPYAARLAQVFRHNPAVLEEVLTGLFLVGLADNAGLSPAKSNFLRRIAVIFGFNETDFVRIAARSGVRLPDQPTPTKKNEDYIVFGLSEKASDVEVKRTYRALIRKHHPDKLTAQGLPPELIAQATEKMKRLNAAYDRICKARGLK